MHLLRARRDCSGVRLDVVVGFAEPLPLLCALATFSPPPPEEHAFRDRTASSAVPASTDERFKER
jgi:hypothetical protein